MADLNDAVVWMGSARPPISSSSSPLPSIRRPFRTHQLQLVSSAEEHPPNGGARGEVVIAVGNEHGDTSSNPGRE